jgi:prefoldin subunit 5
MAKALKVFVVLLLLLSITALVLAINLYGKREQLKGRTQNLEKAVVDTALELNKGEEPFIKDLNVAIDANRLMIYENELNPADTMAPELAKLVTLAKVRYGELGTTYADLKKTSDELAQTRMELAQTRQDLENARAEIVQLNDTITQRNAEIARQQDQIGTLEREKGELQVTIDDLNNQIATLEDEKQDQRDKIATLEQTIVELENILGGPEGPKRVVPKGLHGRVVVVNKDWNFVILDVGSKAGLGPNSELLVHRGDKLVGKVYVSGVTRDLAIADVKGDWQQLPIREGDSVAAQ